VRSTPLPYALAQAEFRFPALTAVAARLPLGSGRESAVAALLAARLATSFVTGVALTPAQRAERGAAASHWLGSTCPDARMRAACISVADAAGSGDAAQAGRALARVQELLAPIVSADARAELAELVAALTA